MRDSTEFDTYDLYKENNIKRYYLNVPERVLDIVISQIGTDGKTSQTIHNK